MSTKVTVIAVAVVKSKVVESLCVKFSEVDLKISNDLVEETTPWESQLNVTEFATVWVG